MVRHVYILFVLASASAVASVDEATFHSLMDRVEGFYRPLVARHSAVLKMERLWDSDDIDASAFRRGSEWVVRLDGGLARRPLVSPDALTLVLCHEMGHQLGGYPFTGLTGIEWMTAEAQTDYFATLSCARELWRLDFVTNLVASAVVSPYAQRECDSVWASLSDRVLCYRIANAAQVYMNDLALRFGEAAPSFATPETKPEMTVQCRLDTLLQGALCTAPFDPTVIPGYLHPDGLNSAGARLEAEKSSCHSSAGYSKGLKPSCWYGPYGQP